MNPKITGVAFTDKDVDDTLTLFDIHSADPKEAKRLARHVWKRATGRYLDRQRYQHQAIKEATNDPQA